MKKPDYWQESIDYLRKKDKKLAKIIDKNKNYSLNSDKNSLESLLRSIVSQQISLKAAASIWQRIINLVDTATAHNILKAGAEELKTCGLSAQKAQYFINIAKHFKKNQINDKLYYSNRSYAEISDELIQIKGIGPWTVEMFAMFFLQEPDIMPLKDLGIIRAINQLYSVDGKDLEMAKIIAISNQWRPYRTVACLFLWLVVDN